MIGDEFLGRPLARDRWGLRCWLGQPYLNRSSAAALEKLVQAPVKTAEDRARRGRALSLLGRFAEARRELLSAAREKNPPPGALGWLGELLVMGGQPGAALEPLDAACRAEPDRPWLYAWRAAARCQAGDLTGSRQDIEGLGRGLSGSPAPEALLGVLEAMEGRREQAELRLARALKPAPVPWILGLRAAMRSRWNDLKGARDDADASLRGEESPLLRLERASIVRRMGEFLGPLADLKIAAAQLPQDPEPLVRAAAIQLDQAQYAAAVANLEKALALRPRDAALHRQLARVRFVQGRWDEAQSAIDRALALCPGDPHMRAEQIQLLIVRDRHAAARRSLGKNDLPPGAKEFWLGYLETRLKNFAEGERLFRAALKIAPPDSEPGRRAGLYRWAARLLAETPPIPKPPGRELFLMGLGYKHLYQSTAGSLAALRECDAIFSNLSDPKITDFLGLFPVPYKPIVFRGYLHQALESTKQVMAGFSRHKRVAMVTRGHVLVYGRLGHELVKAARRLKIPVTLPTSTSIFEVLPALLADPPREPFGYQVRDSVHYQPADPALPLFLYTPKDSRVRLCETLKTVYAPKASCYMLAGSGDGEFSAEKIFMKDLLPALDAADWACTVYFPAGQPGPAKPAGKSPLSVSRDSSPVRRRRMEPKISVSPCLELLAGLQLLSGVSGRPLPGFWQNGLSYGREILARFQSHSNHAAVAAYRSAWDAGLDPSTAVCLFLHCSRPEKIRLDMEPHPWGGFERVQGRLGPLLPGLLQELSRLARAVRFSEFLAAQEPFYAACAAQVGAGTRDQDFSGWWEDYTGLKLKAVYQLYLSPLMEPGLQVHHVHGFDRVFSVTGPRLVETGRPRFEFPELFRFWHEMGRTVLDPILERHKESVDLTRGLWAPARDASNRSATWEHCLREHVAQAVALRVRETALKAGRLPPGPAPRPAGVPYASAILEALKTFEDQRGRFKDLAEYYPRLLESLKSVRAKGAKTPTSAARA